MSRRYKCVGFIIQTGKSSFGLFPSVLVFKPRVSGSIPGWVTNVDLFGAGMPREYYWLSKWGGRRSVRYNLVAVVVPRVS